MKVKGVELGDECALCGATENLEVHHILPISKGGTNEIENLAILCRRCNHKIRDKIVPVVEKQFRLTQFGGDGTRENFRHGMEYTVNVPIGGETLKQVMTVRGNREKETGRITPVAELVREAVGYWYTMIR